MRRLSLLLLGLVAGPLVADEAAKPVLIAKPDAFKTLVNPMCSHCRDEAKRRAGELRDDDRVLCWVRGYSDGGAIPLRFFLNPYRVISDTYGVFVYDPDAGYARGFAASLDFSFYGWRNGVMVMKHKDGTLYSCLTGIAFDGPRKGDRLKPVPTLMSDWGFWLKRYPQAVAYHMFDKYRPVELPATEHPDSVKSRRPADKRLPADTPVLGVALGETTRAYPLSAIEKAGLIADTIDGKDVVVLWQGETRTAAAYHPLATRGTGKGEEKPKKVTLRRDDKVREAPFVDTETSSRWDIAGRAVEGTLKGWTLEWIDGTQVKWFAWAAEHPRTTLHKSPDKTGEKKPGGKPLEEKVREIAGSAEFLYGVPKHFAKLEAVDAGNRRVRLLIEGEKLAKLWPLTDDAEVKVHGWWGRLDQFQPGDRVWAWFKLDRRKQPVAIMMLADELSEEDIHGAGVTLASRTAERITLKPVKGSEFSLTVRPSLRESVEKLTVGQKVYVQSAGGAVRLLLDAAGFESLRMKQREALTKRWESEGLPGSVTFLHLSGEADFMLDHEAIRWGRSLKPGDKVSLQADPPIAAVVRHVRPWRERTQLRLVIHGLDLADLKLGDRLRLKMTPPPREVLEASLPPDVDRSRSRDERVEWFLASIYCTCPVKGDRCTGMFYTLASCNPNGCGMPNAMRKHLAGKIDRGMTDRQIFEEMLKTYGPALTRPHLLP
jgi:hypothetical protein